MGGDSQDAGLSRSPDRGAEDELLREAADLRARPGFGRAVYEYALGLARFREGSRLINKIIAFDKRHRVIGYLLYLHFDRELFGPMGGATYGRLFDLCTRRNEVKPRMLKTTLAMLRFAGFITVARSETDRRSKFYRPTAKMMSFVENWLFYAVSSLDAAQPEMQRAALLRNDPTFVERFLVSGGRDHRDNTPPADRMPEFIGFFGGREGGNSTILAVMLADFDGAQVPNRAFIAKRYGLSKTQLTNVIVEGERLGFFSTDAAGVPLATPKLREDFNRWISIELAFYARHMQPLAGA